MVSQEIILREKEYLVNVLGKKLIDSDEYDKNYKRLASKHWPEYWDYNNLGKRKQPKIIKGYEVHHIDFNHSNNVLSNLVVLTISEHEFIHNIFDPKYVDIKKIRSECATNQWSSEENRQKQREWYIEYYSNDENKQRLLDGMKAFWDSERSKELREERSKIKKEYWSKPENKETLSKRMKEYWRKKKEGLI